jgi:hypothetical protein
MKYHRFYRDPTSDNWYIDLPSYPGPVADLQMVMGADVLLGILANNYFNEVDVTFAADPFEGADTLTLTRLGDDEGGAYYTCNSIMGLPYDFPVWLCDVTLHVFGNFPPTIYFR